MSERFSRKKKRVIIWLTIILAVAACTVLIAGNILRHSFAMNEKLKIIYIPKTREETDFWSELALGAESAAKEHQAELEILAPDAEKNTQQQRDYIRRALNERPDVLAVSPSLYSEMTELLKEVTEAGIPLVLIDSQLNEKIQTSYIGTDNVDAGVKMGEKVLEYVKEDTRIAIISQSKGTSTAMEREEGFRKGLAGEEKRVEKVLYCESDRQIACKMTKELLTEQPEINCVVGLNLPAVTGAAQAVDEMGLAGQITVIGIDNDETGIAYMEKGVIDALIVQKPFHMGYFGIKTAIEIARGKEVEPIIYSDTEVITIDNIYASENEKLLFSF